MGGEGTPARLGLRRLRWSARAYAPGDRLWIPDRQSFLLWRRSVRPRTPATAWRRVGTGRASRRANLTRRHRF